MKKKSTYLTDDQGNPSSTRLNIAVSLGVVIMMSVATVAAVFMDKDPIPIVGVITSLLLYAGGTKVGQKKYEAK
jgi:hypothetical protein